MCIQLQARVTVVEDLNKARQPFKDMEAVYMLSPTLESVEKVKADFTSTKTVSTFNNWYSTQYM
jgi:hypothetical protein